VDAAAPITVPGGHRQSCGGAFLGPAGSGRDGGQIAVENRAGRLFVERHQPQPGARDLLERHLTALLAR
jgi:hypothetical protein